MVNFSCQHMFLGQLTHTESRVGKRNTALQILGICGLITVASNQRNGDRMEGG